MRAGGHAYTGASPSRSAVVVDLRRLHGIHFSDGIATVGPGARNIDVYAALAGHGVTIPSGSCPTVGIGGLATGGAAARRRTVVRVPAGAHGERHVVLVGPAHDGA